MTFRRPRRPRPRLDAAVCTGCGSCHRRTEHRIVARRRYRESPELLARVAMRDLVYFLKCTVCARVRCIRPRRRPGGEGGDQGLADAG